MKKYTVKQVIKKQKRFDKMDFFYDSDEKDWLFPALLCFGVGGSIGVTHIEQLVKNGWHFDTGDIVGVVMYSALIAFGLGKTLSILWHSFKEDYLFDKMSDKLEEIYANQGLDFEREVKEAISNGRR